MRRTIYTNARVLDAALSIYRFGEISEVRSNIIKKLKSVSKSQKPNICVCRFPTQEEKGRRKKNVICNFKQMENKSNPNKYTYMVWCDDGLYSVSTLFHIRLVSCGSQDPHSCACDFIFITLLFTHCADFISLSRVRWIQCDRNRFMWLSKNR